MLLQFLKHQPSQPKLTDENVNVNVGIKIFVTQKK